MEIDPGQIMENNNIPDSPYHIGITGKYKLLIRSVTPKFDGYEYELVDADGKEYKADSPKHYALDQLLRCMVHFKVVNAAFFVTDTHICSKQDFATALPEEKKTKSRPIIEPKMVDDPRLLDNPRQTGKPGLYYLRVVGCDKLGAKNVYWVMDAEGCKYKVDTPTKKNHPLGKVVVCSVFFATVKGSGLTIKIQAISKRQTTAPKPSKKHKVKHVKSRSRYHSSHDWLGTPCVGDHFHLIYTPMGNKR